MEKSHSHLVQDPTRDKISKFYIDNHSPKGDLFQNVIKSCLAHVYIVIQDCDSHKCDKETHESRTCIKDNHDTFCQQ